MGGVVLVDAVVELIPVHWACGQVPFPVARVVLLQAPYALTAGPWVTAGFRRRESDALLRPD